MKNEGAYILEWAAYHLSIGVDHFLVYTNDCTDGTDQIWLRLAEMGLATHVANDKIKARGIQKTALMRAEKHPLTRKAEWLGCLDVDEFINIKHGEGTLDDLFDVAPDADMFMLAWRRFGANGRAGFADQNILEQFTRAAPENCPYPFHNYGVKSLWRADAPFGRIGVHRANEVDPKQAEDVQVVNGAGATLPGYAEKGLWLTPATSGYAGAQVNHYSLRSAECFLLKCERGLPNSKITQLDLGYWAERNFNNVEDRSIQRRMPAMAEKLAELKSDSKLKALHDTACRWRHENIQRLLHDPAMLKLFLRIIATETSVVSPRHAGRLNELIARSWQADRAERDARKARNAERRARKARS
ncbi:MAG: glycosyltransferase family 2 protein [Pikeienuella sp.]